MMTSSSVPSLGTQSPLYTWTWSHHSSLPVVAPAHCFWIYRISVLYDLDNNSSAPAHKVLKRPMFSPEGNLQNFDMSPKMKYRFSKVLYSKFWGLTRFDYILDICSFNNCWRAVGEILLWLNWGVSRWKRAHSRMWSSWRIVTISHDDRAIWPQRNAFLSFFILPISNSTVIWYLSCARYFVRCQ